MTKILISVIVAILISFVLTKFKAWISKSKDRELDFLNKSGAPIKRERRPQIIELEKGDKLPVDFHYKGEYNYKEDYKNGDIVDTDEGTYCYYKGKWVRLY